MLNGAFALYDYQSLLSDDFDKTYMYRRNNIPDVYAPNNIPNVISTMGFIFYTFECDLFKVFLFSKNRAQEYVITLRKAVYYVCINGFRNY